MSVEQPKTWIGRKVNAVAWRKIFEKHPEVAQCFMPGNEQMLKTIRQRRPRLDSTLCQLGPPPKEIVNEILQGSSISISHSMKYNAQDGLDESSFRQFFSDGYVVVRNAVPLPLVDAALRHINACIGRGALNQQVPGLIGVEQHSSFFTIIF
mmetsp:Transcript_9697/g.11958  ORF Transcript_9697/g.11958 Transcript_9697/m.11958 type:complete len:152 (+) Transcript_9697:70-525(+)